MAMLVRQDAGRTEVDAGSGTETAAHCDLGTERAAVIAFHLL